MTPLLAENLGSSLMPVLLIVMGTLMMVILLRRRQFPRSSGRELVREQIDRMNSRAQLHGTLDELLIQLEEASRRVGAEIDTKYARLEALLRDADLRIARLEQLGDARRTTPEPSEAEASAPVQDEPAQPTPPAGSESSSQAAREPVAERFADDARFRRIFELVDGGASPIAVAERLGMPLGEVELIINLRKYG